MSKVKLPEDVKYILQCTKGWESKTRFTDNRHHVERRRGGLRELLAHRPIRNCRDGCLRTVIDSRSARQQEIQANRAYLDIDIDGDFRRGGESYGEYQCADVFVPAEAGADKKYACR